MTKQAVVIAHVSIFGGWNGLKKQKAHAEMNIAKLGISSPEWCAFVEAHPNSNIFHHPAWAGLIADCYGYEPFVLANLDQSGQVNAGIPFMNVVSWMTGHRWVSLPFSDHCAPLFYEQPAFDALIDHLLLQYYQRSIPRIEIRANIPHKNMIYHENSFVWHTIKLMNDPDILLRTFHKTRVREKIRQAVERGVEVGWGTSQTDMGIFYDMFVDTHRRLGVPVQPRRYFDMLWKRLIDKQWGFLLMAYKGHEPVAGTIFLRYKRVLAAKYNASLPEYWNLKANNLIYWTAIKWACENKFTDFDFGRTDVQSKSLRDYKNGWGTVETPLDYSVIADNSHNQINGRLEGILHFVMKKSPLWVCQLSGQLLYKHFG
jgi:hypothetical protein